MFFSLKTFLCYIFPLLEDLKRGYKKVLNFGQIQWFLRQFWRKKAYLGLHKFLWQLQYIFHLELCEISLVEGPFPNIDEYFVNFDFFIKLDRPPFRIVGFGGDRLNKINISHFIIMIFFPVDFFDQRCCRRRLRREIKKPFIKKGRGM